MKRSLIILLSSILLLASCCEKPWTDEVQGLIKRQTGRTSELTLVEIPQQNGLDCYSIDAQNGHLTIKASSASAMGYAFDRYLREACHSMICWSGKRMDLPSSWPDYQEEQTCPYEYRYFLNVCTFGYTAPYWDWDRWSEEIDWMILHGVNMPLASVASEAIARRVWLKMGLSDEEINEFFTGPAHLPWHRMGNLNHFDGPLDANWHKSQIKLQHKILKKMRAMGMQPIAPAFAGFVPLAFLKAHPDAAATLLTWGGFPAEDNACVLSPDSPYFQEIGKLFVEEWEKEFGKADFYLSDSFNEMRLPVDKDDTEGKHRILSEYGKAIYSSIAAGNPDAVWVTQGWTFGYQHDFWDPESLKALLSEVPDDKMIIIDLGNDYPKWVWNTEQTWKVQNGFHGKKWIFSYVPNFGGKVLPTGDLQMYASSSAEALHNENKGNLVGFGSAPEGLENNEIVYELLSDMGWSSEGVDLDEWCRSYCLARYGSDDARLLKAMSLLRESVWSNLYSYPRFLWQTVVPDTRRVSRHNIGEEFKEALLLMLECAPECSSSELYRNDIIEFAAFSLSADADKHYARALEAHQAGRESVASDELHETIAILENVDRLLASHPNHRLDRWIESARRAAGDKQTADHYESNAKRLITTWGGWQEDYAARLWSGLISDYYIPRLEKFFSTSAQETDAWEEEWIQSRYERKVEAFDDPVAMAEFLVKSPQSTFTAHEQLRAVKALINRVTEGRADEFEIRLEGDDDKSFTYGTHDGKVLLCGGTGVAVASALNAYLKNECGWHYTWCGKNTALPKTFPLPKQTTTRHSPFKYRYYLNYCTFNYSMSWWDFDRWQQEIDWMALNGINMPLAVTGQNSIWRRVYHKLGLTDEDLETFFSGPAYFNWFWMGNLDGWGGPLPQSFMERHEELQKKILYQERSLGMTPILPSFTGHVPSALVEKYPNIKFKNTNWVNFPQTFVLDPSEEMFSTIGKLFLETQTEIYGTNHFYTADTFNENEPPTSDPAYLSGVSAKVYHAMSEVDPEAVWVMQGWMFYHERSFWHDPQIEALLSAVPDDKMLILDLWSERFPVWSRTNAYFGKPWLWCMLHNFGQNITLSGNATSVANDPAAALADPSSGKMSGIGLTPEGIGHTPIIYALMLENVWNEGKPIDIDSFIESYTTNRYGKLVPEAVEAWKIIFATAFENDVNNGGHESIISGRPTFKENPKGCTNTNKCYERIDLVKAWEKLYSCADALSHSDGYRYDLVDITRQVLADYASVIQQRFAADYRNGDLEAFKANSKAFDTLIADMDKLLATREELLLGRWLESAKAMGTTEEESRLYEQNARNLLGTWGNQDCKLFDYACKQWSGMMNGYYRHRWALFFENVLENWGEFEQDAFARKCKEYEWNWIFDTECFPTEKSGDEIKVVKSIWKKYNADLRNE